MRTLKTFIVLGAVATIGFSCDSNTGPGSGTRIDHLEIRLAPVRQSYPVPDTVRASVTAVDRDGTPVPVDGAIWRTLTPLFASVDRNSGLIQTHGRGEAVVEVQVGGVTAQLTLPIRGVLHKALFLDISETWHVADTPHVVGTYLNVGGIFDINAPDTAVLTIEPGATVRFRPGAGLIFGDIEPGALRIAAGAPVIMEADWPLTSRGSWVGLFFQGHGRSELRNLMVRHCGADSPGGNPAACLEAAGDYPGKGPELFLDGVTIAEGLNGVSISHWVTLAAGSRNLSVENTVGYVARISPQVVGTFPRGGHFTGNAESEIRITNGQVDQSATWTELGLPLRLGGGVLFTGPANPILTLPAGVHLRGDPGATLSFASGGLVAGDPAGAPVILESTGQGWGGIGTAHAGLSALRNVVLQDCGAETAACLSFDGVSGVDSGIAVQDVVIRGSRSTGIYVGIGGTFHPSSRTLTVTGGAGVPFDLMPEGIASLPAGDYRGNAIDVIRMRSGDVRLRTTWRDLGIPYRAPGLQIDSALTLAPGVTMQVGVGGRVVVRLGSLVAVGTATAPVTFTSATPGVPGSWMGIEIESWTGGAGTRLEYVEIADAGAGPGGYAGALRLWADPGGLLRNSTIRRSTSCALILFGGQSWTDDYADPAFGNTFIDVAGPPQCQPLP
jgi:hypothetical protein